jgi:DNA repair exonuclease SbcCD ATPase subunit
MIERDIEDGLQPMEIGPDEWVHVVRTLAKFSVEWLEHKGEMLKAYDMQLASLQDRLARLTDAYIDQTIDKELFQDRKAALLNERATLNEQRTAITSNLRSIPDSLREFLELAGRAKILYKTAISEEKRDLLGIVTSNRVLKGKNVVVELSNPFADIANRPKAVHGAPCPDVPRTWKTLLPKLAEAITGLSDDVLDTIHTILDQSGTQSDV